MKKYLVGSMVTAGVVGALIAAPLSSADAGDSSATARLMAALPDGYDAGVCRPVTPPVADALATVDCDQNSMPGGPAGSRYSLYPDQATLDRHFEASYKADEQIFSCPGSSMESPTTWHYTSTPDSVEGQVACGTYKGNADVTWTRNRDGLIGDAQSNDINSLHQWWLQYG